jgi:putative inorganic carbon (HCO3(-)) transporter
LVVHSEKHGESRLEKSLDTLIRGGLLLLVLLAPLPFGSVEPWAFSVLELGVAALALLYLYRLFLIPARTKVVFSPLLLPVAGFILLMVAQLLPLPSGVLRLVSPETSALYGATSQDAAPDSTGPAEAAAATPGATRRSAPDWRPLTQMSFATRTYLMKGLAFSLFLFLFLNAFREAIQIRSALYLLVAVGTFQAFYGVLEYLSGHQHIFAYQKRYYIDAATGTFINRNHYAAFLEMTLLAALGLFFSRWREPQAGETWRERLLALTDRRASLNLTLLLCVGIVSVGLVLSYSRAGIILGLAVAGCFCLTQIRHGWSLQKTLLMALLAAVVVVPIYGVGYWTLTGRYALLTGEMTTQGGRIAVWRKTAEIIRDYPLLGTGVGTFQYVFPRYRDATTTAFYDFAHSDYLQVFSEAGVLGLALLASGVFLVAKAWRGDPREVRTGETVLRSACGFALLSVGLHEAFDFSLQIPANLLAATLVAGCLVVLAATSARASSEDRLP